MARPLIVVTPLLVVIFTLSIAAIASGLPISFGGIGVYPAALALLRGLGGVARGDALLVALLMRPPSVLVSLTGLPSALLRWRERRAAAE